MRGRHFPIERGSDDEAAEHFPSGGSLILAESPAHALSIAAKMRINGHRAITRSVYVRTTCDMRAEVPRS